LNCIYCASRSATGECLARPDAERARRYFRLCAAAQNPACRFKTGQSLLPKPPASDREAVQATAWIELSADQDFFQSQTLLE
jgi:hypothetical protein